MSIPIPKRPSGYAIGATDAPITVEMFFDLECPFSKRGWNHAMQVVKAYSADQVRWVFQPMTLGNHRQSWDATKAAIALADGNPQTFVKAASYIFSRQKEFANEAWKDKTQTEFHTLLASYAVNAIEGTHKETFLAKLNSKEVYAEARIPARYATARGVWSTPTFLINGAEATALSSSSNLSDWKSIIDPLLS